jgi:NAD(P)-dependent dehydrogenase (short-subunit alcohol dehydrogenase family)
VSAPTQLLRPGLLEERALLLAGAGEGDLGRAVRAACEGLGAVVEAVPLIGSEGSADTGGAPDVLVIDLLEAFAAAGLVRAMDAAWSVTSAVASSAFLPQERGGRVIYVAPPPGAGEHAAATCAAVENLARTLSIEWARFGVTTVAIAPGASSAPRDLATLIAYLSSSAGAYFSGCLLDLRGD